MVEDTVEYRIYYRVVSDPYVQHMTYPFAEEQIATNYKEFAKLTEIFDVKLVKETIIREVIQPTLIH